MTPATHQTIKLNRGKHASPGDGACVMELASMLAGEPFSDHPASTCPVIGSFLRAYNDSIDDRRRRDLYAVAAQVVGSRSSIDIQRGRAARLADWAFEMQRRQWRSRLRLGRLRTNGRRRARCVHAIGTFAVRTIPKHTDETHREVLELVDQLLAMGAAPVPKRAPDLAETLPAALCPVR